MEEMAWVEFTADFTYRGPQFAIDYKKGMKMNIPKAQADAAKKVQRAVDFDPATAANGQVQEGRIFVQDQSTAAQNPQLGEQHVPQPQPGPT